MAWWTASSWAMWQLHGAGQMEAGLLRRVDLGEVSGTCLSAAELVRLGHLLASQGLGLSVRVRVRVGVGGGGAGEGATAAVSAVAHGGVDVPVCDGWSWTSRELVGPVVTHPADGTRYDLSEVGMSGVQLGGGDRVATGAARWTVSRADGRAGGVSVASTLAGGGGQAGADGEMRVGVPGSVLAIGVLYRVVSSAHVVGVGWFVSCGAGQVDGVSFSQTDPAPTVEVHVADVACAPPVFDVTVVSRRRRPVEVELVVSGESESAGPPEVWRGTAHGSRVQVGPVAFGRRVRVCAREGGVVSQEVAVQVMSGAASPVDLRAMSVDEVGVLVGGLGRLVSGGMAAPVSVRVSGAAQVAHWIGLRAAGVEVVAGVPLPSVVVVGGGADGTCPADGWVEAATSMPDGEVTRTDVWLSDADGDGEDPVGREPGPADVIVHGDRTRRVQLVDVAAGRRYAVRVRVWRGSAVSHWSGRVVAVIELPWQTAMRLPAMDLGVDLAALSWGEPVTIDTAGNPHPAEFGCAGR